LPGVDDWDGVDPLGSAIEGGGDGGGRGFAGGGRDLVASWFCAEEWSKDK
jgi:hypothetical protein